MNKTNEINQQLIKICVIDDDIDMSQALTKHLLNHGLQRPVSVYNILSFNKKS